MADVGVGGEKGEFLGKVRMEGDEFCCNPVEFGIV